MPLRFGYNPALLRSGDSKSLIDLPISDPPIEKRKQWSKLPSRLEVETLDYKEIIFKPEQSIDRLVALPINVEEYSYNIRKIWVVETSGNGVWYYPIK